LLLTAVVASVGCFPYAYAWLETGNPVFPFFNDLFQSPFFPPSSFRDNRWAGNANWSIFYDVTFSSSHFAEVGTGALGLTLIVMVPLAVAALVARPDPRALLCLGIAAVVALVVGSQIQYLRYFYPIFPLLLVAAAPGLMLLLQQRYARTLVLVLVIAMMSFNIYKLPAGGWVLFNLDLRAAYDPVIRRQLESTYAPERLANKLINDAAGGTSRVLYMRAPYGGLLQGEALYPDWYNLKLFGELKDVKTPQQAGQLLRRWAVTHVVGTSGTGDLSKKPLDAYLVANYRPIALFGPLSVYDIRSTP
jgi:hypothetical protein